MFSTSPDLNLARSTWHNFAEVSACSATKPRAVNEPNRKSSFRLLTVPNQNGYHSPMHPHSPSPGLVAPTSVIHKKEMDLASTARANLKLLVDPSQRTVKTKEEVKSVFKAKLVE